MCKRSRWLSRAILIVLLFAATVGCKQEQNAREQVALDVPRAYSDVLSVERGGRVYQFGPFVGYYFKPIEPNDFSRVEFVCFNENGFYASDMPVNAKLFEGEAVLTKLPAVDGAIPTEGDRIRPVFFDEAPEAWLQTRPDPQDLYVHFHSLHDGSGASLFGYWIRHEAVAAFTYDMGGRVDETSSLYHHVEPGPDDKFDRIIEFDFGG